MSRVKSLWSQYGLLVAFVTIVLVAGLGLLKIGSQQEQIERLVVLQAQERTQSCIKSRTALQPYFEDRLQESLRHGIAYYRDRFPQFTVHELVHSVESQREGLRDVVRALDPEECK